MFSPQESATLPSVRAISVYPSQMSSTLGFENTATGSLLTYVSMNPESHASFDFGNFESFSKDDQVLNSEIENILAAELALFPNAIVPLDDLVYFESQIDRFTQYFTNIGKSESTKDNLNSESKFGDLWKALSGTPPLPEDNFSGEDILTQQAPKLHTLALPEADFIDPHAPPSLQPVSPHSVEEPSLPYYDNALHLMLSL